MIFLCLANFFVLWLFFLNFLIGSFLIILFFLTRRMCRSLMITRIVTKNIRLFCRLIRSLLLLRCCFFVPYCSIFLSLHCLESLWVVFWFSLLEILLDMLASLKGKMSCKRVWKRQRTAFYYHQPRYSLYLFCLASSLAFHTQKRMPLLSGLGYSLRCFSFNAKGANGEKLPCFIAILWLKKCSKWNKYFALVGLFCIFVMSIRH